MQTFKSLLSSHQSTESQICHSYSRKSDFKCVLSVYEAYFGVFWRWGTGMGIMHVGISRVRAEDLRGYGGDG